MRGAPGVRGEKGINYFILYRFYFSEFHFKKCFMNEGDAGEPGLAGANGLDGAPGKAGANGKDGENGKGI